MKNREKVEQSVYVWAWKKTLQNYWATNNISKVKEELDENIFSWLQLSHPQYRYIIMGIMFSARESQ